MNQATARVLINVESLRQILSAEKDCWIKLRQYFNLNHEIIESLAGEQVYGLGCFAGLLSFINASSLCRYEEVIAFLKFEKENYPYMKAIRKIDDVNQLNQKQLGVLFNYYLRRSILVSDFVDATLQHIEKLKST